jgi:magnesium chelatase family protein
MHVEVPRVPNALLRAGDGVGESSAQVRQRTAAARERQRARAGKTNSLLSSREVDRHCALAPADQALFEQAVERLGLSARAYHRILRLARTIADLAGSAAIETGHLSEALSYRRLDRGVAE